MKHLAMALVRFYRRFLSGLKPTPTCRFTPTCSAYSLEAFEKRGFFAGLILTLWRILRCSPLSPCGFDPVPKSGFKTMPLRWSRFDRYRAETCAAENESASEDDPPDPSEEGAPAAGEEIPPDPDEPT